MHLRCVSHRIHTAGHGVPMVFPPAAMGIGELTWRALGFVPHSPDVLLGSAAKKGQTVSTSWWDLRHPHNPMYSMRKHSHPPQKGTVWEFHFCFSIIPHPACLEDILCLSTIKDSGAKAAFCTPALLL